MEGLMNLRERIRRGLKRCEDGALLDAPIPIIPVSPDYAVHKTLQIMERELTKIIGDAEIDPNDLGSPGQREWQQLRRKHGEDGAERLVAKKLRAFADKIEEIGYPKIFGCHVNEKEGFGDLMESIEVTLSHRWPG